MQLCVACTTRIAVRLFLHVGATCQIATASLLSRWVGDGSVMGLMGVRTGVDREGLFGLLNGAIGLIGEIVRRPSLKMLLESFLRHGHHQHLKQGGTAMDRHSSDRVATGTRLGMIIRCNGMGIWHVEWACSMLGGTAKQRGSVSEQAAARTWCGVCAFSLRHRRHHANPSQPSSWVSPAQTARPNNGMQISFD